MEKRAPRHIFTVPEFESLKMSIEDKLLTPENLYTEIPEPPEWMNPTTAKLFEHICEYYLEGNCLLKTSIEYLYMFAHVEYRVVMERVKGLPIDIELNQRYKSFCDDMEIDSNVNNRINWLKELNWSFEDGKNTRTQ